MKPIAAAEFKAKCLALIDGSHDEGESITITRRGRTVARLVPAGDKVRPWLRVRGTLRKYANPFAPAVDQLARDERPYLSAISLWEVAMLVERL